MTGPPKFWLGQTKKDQRDRDTAGLPLIAEGWLATVTDDKCHNRTFTADKGLWEPKRSRLGIDHFERRLCPLEIWLVEALRKTICERTRLARRPYFARVGHGPCEARPQAANKPTEPAKDAFSSRVDPAI